MVNLMLLATIRIPNLGSVRKQTDTSVGTVQIFHFIPGFGTEASVPVLVARFWFLLLETRVSVQGFLGVV